MSNQAERAEIVARTAFAKDWHGLAHTVQVVNELLVLDPAATDEEIAAAWLHDVVEDTDVDFVDLSDMAFTSPIVDATRLLSRAEGSDYPAYKERLFNAVGIAGRIARKVKLADARVNLKRCKEAVGIPKWERLGNTRYAPLVAELEARLS